jgi:GT2 family glycosyltransferase
MENLNSVDIIIVNYKSTDYLLKCLESVYASVNGLPANVFVHDNASGNGINRVNDQFPQAKVCHNTYNMGFSASINKTIKQTSSPFVVLLNPDSVVIDGFFESAIKYMKENPNVGIIGPKILDQDGSVQGSARIFPNFLSGFFGRTSLMTRLFPDNPITRQNFFTKQHKGKDPINVDWVSGACMVARRDMINDVGYMDEQYFLYFEDIDWCKAIWQKGWRVVYFPKASIVHYGGVSSSKKPFRSIFEFHVSSYRYFIKHTKWPKKVLLPAAILGISARCMFKMLVHIATNKRVRGAEGQEVEKIRS